MRVETHTAFAVAYCQVRVVVFGIGNEGHCIDEADGLVVILEAKSLLQRLVNHSPARHLFAVELAQLRDDFSGAKCAAVGVVGVFHEGA